MVYVKRNIGIFWQLMWVTPICILQVQSFEFLKLCLVYSKQTQQPTKTTQPSPSRKGIVNSQQSGVFQVVWFIVGNESSWNNLSVLINFPHLNIILFISQYAQWIVLEDFLLQCFCVCGKLELKREKQIITFMFGNFQ